MIEAVSKNNLAEVLPLIRAYQEFYKVSEISDDRNSVFFAQFGESSPVGCQFIYRQTGIVVGFATIYFSFTTTIAAKVAVLNDLYTLPNHRGNGIGRQPIGHCRTYAATNEHTLGAVQIWHIVFVPATRLAQTSGPIHSADE